MKHADKIIKNYSDDEVVYRKIGWLVRTIIIPIQKRLVAKYLSVVSNDNFYNALLFGKDIGAFQVKQGEVVPMAHSQVRTHWQRCGVAMQTYDYISEDLKRQGRRLIENPDQQFVRPAAKALWKKRREQGKCST